MASMLAIRVPWPRMENKADERDEEIAKGA